MLFFSCFIGSGLLSHLYYMVHSSTIRSGPRRPGRPRGIRGAVVGRRDARGRSGGHSDVRGRSALMADAVVRPEVLDIQLLRRGGRAAQHPVGHAVAGLFIFAFLFFDLCFVISLLHALIVCLLCLCRIFFFNACFSWRWFC